MMFERFGKFLQGLGGVDEPRLTREDPRVAAAALFYHIIDADGVSEPVEREKIRELLQKEYALDKDELRDILKAGKRAEDESIDFYAFTSVLKRSLDAEQRVLFIELLWEIVYADGVRHELEESIVGRVAELMGVSDRDRVLMRQEAERKTGAEGES
jgi:uncharacterized tellurite resistance protein B-like protein